MKRPERVWKDPPMPDEEKIWIPKEFMIGAILLPVVLGLKEVVLLSLNPGLLPSLEFLIVFAISPLLGGTLLTVALWSWGLFWGEKQI